MNCPVCSVPLNMMERQGVEIDYCSQCRGVWLDRGELDKIIERSAVAPGATGSTSSAPQSNQSTYPQTPPASGYSQTPPYPNNPTGYNQPPPQYPNTHSGYAQPQYPNTPYNQPYYKKKKHESFLGELFDFD